MDAAGGNERPLTSGPDADAHPTWSPDGSTIVFERSGLAAGSHILKVAASGGATTALTAGPAGEGAPSFSPDGSKIVFASASAIQIMDSSGANQHALTAPGADLNDIEPAFAPDGTQIVFERYYHGVPPASPLLVMNADGSNQHLISGPSETLFRADRQPLHPAPAPPPPPPSTPPTPPVADESAPGLALAAPGKESVRKGALHVFATSSEPVTAVARGNVAKIPPPAPGDQAARGERADQDPAQHPRKHLRAIRAALGRGMKPKATIVVRVEDGAGNLTTEALTIRVKR